MKKVILSALLMGFAAASFAEVNLKSESTSTAVVKWFHFNGDASNPSDLSDPAKYSPAPSDMPTCPDNIEQYRCDIQILSQESNQDLPDLSQSVLEERTRENAQ